MQSVTIITVVYNGATYLEKTILSVINNSYSDIAYIIIDGGSTDGTLDIIKKYDRQLSYWISEKDLGIYDAMNKGWQMARQDSYILFLGSGDELLDLPVIDFSCDVIAGKVKLGDNKMFNPELSWRLKITNTLHHQALLIRKAFHMPSPFSLSYKIYSDFDFNQRLLKMNARFCISGNFRSYAMPGGISKEYNYKESLLITRKNFGWGWFFFAIIYFSLIRIRDIFK
jgi:glycosyltransferase involved in cell wall biosynthesis